MQLAATGECIFAPKDDQLLPTLDLTHKLGMVLNFSDSGLPSAIGAAIEGLIRLDTMSDDLAAAVIANGRKLVDRTFETVERMTRARRYDLKR